VKVYLLLLFVSALVTYIATPVMRHLAFRIGAVAAVRERDVHKVPTARLGGVAIFLGLAVSLTLASRVPFLGAVFQASGAVWAVIGGAFLVCVIGVIDDIIDLDWMVKLAGQVFAAWIVAWGGVQLVTVPIGGLTIASSSVSLVVTMLVVVIAINAVNFVDGLDGLAAGMIAIGGSAFFIYTYVLQRDASPGDYSSLATMILAALVGACLGFLPHNLHPARIFMGDSGSMVLGLTFASAAIIVTGQIDPMIVSSRGEWLPAFIPILLPVMVVAIPLLDMALAVITRTIRGKSPWSADSHHLHHRLLAFGHSHRWAVSVLYVWTAVLSFGTVSVVFMRLRYAALFMFLGILAASIVTFSPRFRGIATRAVEWVGVRTGRSGELPESQPLSSKAARGTKSS
jgi:UDP-GlcNAc:undecaprenyl-phosphate/decaprenyl-phosphate GlcNAc-1-phosphate transferase